MNYKTSRYNITVDYMGKTLLFNGLTGSLVELDDTVGPMWSQVQSGETQIANLEPAFLDNLVNTHFLVDQELDELSLIKKRSDAAVYGDRAYRLTINPTMNCNFKCWYCYEGHVKSKMTKDTTERVYKHVQQLIENGEINALNLTWFGGEPMMAFASVIYPLSKRLKTLCEEKGLPFQNSITTNAYLVHEKAMPQYHEIGLNNFQITLDGNRERHNEIRFLKGNKRGTYDRIIGNINGLIQNLENVQINLRFNFEDKTLQKVHDVINEFDKDYRHKIHVDFQRVWQTVETHAGSPNDMLKHVIELFRESGYSAGAAANDFTLFQGKKCYADKWYQAVINWDGNVFKCTARDFTPANAEGHLEDDGSVSWKKNKMEARFHRAPWERERCMDCELLPMCMGPCSQAMIEVGEENRNRNCWLDNLELKVEDYVIQRYNALTQQTVEPFAV